MLLRYGMNPHQGHAEAVVPDGNAFAILNGQPSYINFLDALNSWQLVRELKAVSGRVPAAASFKHVNPAGAAIGIPLSKGLQRAYLVDGLDLSPLAAAYARARGTDRMASYGDFVALSDTVDTATAALLTKEVSDGVIAPGYDMKALDLLRKKKGGRYLVLQIDPGFRPERIETREVFGFTLRQDRNDLPIDDSLLANVVTKEKVIPPDKKIDMLIGLTVQKYTQSNSMNLCDNGQTIGVGAGQQSRIQCTRLAIAKANTWFIRRSASFVDRQPVGKNRNETDNRIVDAIQEMSTAQRDEVLAERRDWVLVSDGYLPFRDNVEVSHAAGIKYIVQPGSSVRDDEVIDECDQHGMVMVFTSKRFFTH